MCSVNWSSNWNSNWRFEHRQLSDSSSRTEIMSTSTRVHVVIASVHSIAHIRCTVIICKCIVYAAIGRNCDDTSSRRQRDVSLHWIRLIRCPYTVHRVISNVPPSISWSRWCHHRATWLLAGSLSVPSKDCQGVKKQLKPAVLSQIL